MVQAQVGIHFFQTLVLFFQLPQALEFTGFHPSILLTPFVKGALTDSDLTANVLHATARIIGLEILDDLSFAEFASLHNYTVKVPILYF